MFSKLISWKFFRNSSILFIILLFSFWLGSLSENRNLINKVIADSENQQLLRNAEIVYREGVVKKFDLFQKLDSFKHSISNGVIDSATVERYFRLFFISRFVQTIEDTSFYIKGHLSLMDADLFSYDSISIKLKVDRIKFEEVLSKSQNAVDAKTLILFGNYINQESDYDKKIKIEVLLFLMLISVLSGFLGVYVFVKNDSGDYPFFTFLVRVLGIRQKPRLTSDSLDRIKEHLKFEQIDENDLSVLKIKTADLDELVQKLKRITEEKDLLLKKESNVLKMLISDLKRFSARASGMYERSSLFLFFSFVISIFGIIIFFLLLPQYKTEYKLSEYIGISIRPFLLLTFFQSLSFYLLKQYKGSINDYKYFYSEEKDRKRFLMAFRMLRGDDEVKAKHIIALEILRDKSVPVSPVASDSEDTKPDSPSDIFDHYLKVFENIKGK